MSNLLVGSAGLPFRYTTNGFDMSASTSLILNFTKPDGSTLQKTSGDPSPVTAPAIPLVNDPNVQNQAASTYMQFTTEVADFDEPGTWSVCGQYSDLTRILPGTSVTFEVAPACA